MLPFTLFVTHQCNGLYNYIMKFAPEGSPLNSAHKQNASGLTTVALNVLIDEPTCMAGHAP